MSATSQPDLCLPTKCRYKQCNVKSTETFINSAQKSAGERAGGNQSRIGEQALLWEELRWLSITRSLVLPPSNTTVTGLGFCRELLLGSDLVSWACLRWSFGLTTKGFISQELLTMHREPTRLGGLVLFRTGVDKLQQQPGRAGLDYQKPEAKLWNLSPYMVPQYVFLAFLSYISSPRWNYSFSTLCTIPWRSCPKEELWILEFFTPIPDFPIREDHLNFCFE